MTQLAEITQFIFGQPLRRRRPCLPAASAALRMALYRSGGQTGRDTWSSCHSWISAQSTGGQVNRRKAVQSGMRVPARRGRFFRLIRHLQIPSDFDANKTDFPRVHIRDLLASCRTARDSQQSPKLTVPAGSANDRWRRSTAKGRRSPVWAKMYHSDHSPRVARSDREGVDIARVADHVRTDPNRRWAAALVEIGA